MKGQARLAALLAVLLATAAIAYFFSPSGNPQLPIAARIGPRRSAMAKSRTDTVEAWKTDILARPLIYPGRRAPVPNVIAENAATPPPPPPRLTGVIVGPSSRHALFTNGPGARPVTVQEGERIGPYLVRSIRSDEVIVDGPGGQQSLRPVYQDAAPPAAPQATPQRHAATAQRRFTQLL